MIVITAPTGNIGHQVLANVLAGDEPVRVIVRDPARLPASVRNRVEVIQGSHGDPRVAAHALAGADALFWLLPTDNQAASVEAAYVGFTRPAAEAIREQGVKRVVDVSALGRHTSYARRAGHVTGSLAMDDLIASTGVAFRALTAPSFMDNMLRQVRDQFTGHGISDAMAQGMLDMMIAKDNGLDNGVGRGPGNAIDTPTTFRQWCADTLKPAVQAA